MRSMRTSKRWTDAERQKVRDHYSYIGTRELAKALPGRSPRSIMSAANRLGVKKCQDRLREMGRENVATRYEEPEAPEE